MPTPDRLLAEHRVEGDELLDVDRLELELRGDPLDGVARDEALVLLDEVQERQRRAALHRVVRDHLVNLAEGVGLEVHQRSHSPITKSREPRIDTTSETIAPTHTLGRIERLQNEGARIFSLHGTPPPLETI